MTDDGQMMRVGDGMGLRGSGTAVATTMEGGHDDMLLQRTLYLGCKCSIVGSGTRREIQSRLGAVIENMPG